MTDREIIQALELCDKDPFYCVNCPFYKNRFCRKELKEKSLDLINRQQAEIERLKKVDEAYPCKVDVGNNCLVYAKSLDDYDRLIDDISAEAIKEFAEKLVDVFYSHDKGDAYVREVVYNLVKEMVGEK
jgi:hypothetical protein